jgi:hypothetical protein
MATESRARTRHWAALGHELVLRAIEPFESPTFVFFFFSVVIGVGGIGIWVEIIKFYRPQVTLDPLNGIITSLITFFFALVGTSCTQLIIEESDSKSLRALAQFVLLIAILIGAFSITGVGSSQPGLWLWILASVFALMVWWLANAKSPGLRDPDAPTGGAVTKTLPGNLSDYKIK